MLKNKIKTLIELIKNTDIEEIEVSSFWGIQKNDIGHNMRTILIGPNLKFLKYYDGNEWSVKTLEDDIKNIMKLYSK